MSSRRYLFILTKANACSLLVLLHKGFSFGPQFCLVKIRFDCALFCCKACQMQLKYKRKVEKTQEAVWWFFFFFFNFLSPGIGLPLYKLLDGMTQLLLASVLLLSMLFQPIRMCINYWCVETLR